MATPSSNTNNTNGSETIPKSWPSSNGLNGTSKVQSGSQQTNANNSSSTDSSESSNNKRIDLEKLVVDFQHRLGENWDKYQSALCLFLLGKLSRDELTDELANVLDNQTTRMHNQLLLLNLANSLRESPSVGFSFVGFGGPLAKKQKRKTSSQYEKIKKDIMALPPRERRRLKQLQRDSGKKHMITSSLVMTRQQLLPKIPLYPKQSSSSSSAQSNGAAPPATGKGSGKGAAAPAAEVARVNNTTQWTQDILQGISTLNAAESYEMPDVEMLKFKMTQIMREHGLVGNARDDVMKMMLIGLETHLRSLLENIIDVVRYRKRLYASDEFEAVTKSNLEPAASNNNTTKNKKVLVTLEDVFDTFQQQPLLIDFGGPLLRLNHALLRNDDEVDMELDLEIRSTEKWLEKYSSSSFEQNKTPLQIAGQNNINNSTGVQSTATNPAAGVLNVNAGNSSLTTPASALNSVNSGNEFGTRSELKSLLHNILLSN